MHENPIEMTKKFVYDASSQTRMRVVGHAHTWEQLSPGVRVRRRVVGPNGSWNAEDIDNWSKATDWDFELMLLDL